MLYNRLNVNFNLRNPSSQDDTPINMVIRYNNQKILYSTSEKIKPKFWQNDKSKKGYQRAKQISSFPEYPEFNSRMDGIEKSVKNVFRRYQNDNDNEIPSTKKFKQLLDIEFRRKENHPKSFIAYIDSFIKLSNSRTNPKNGRIISPLTIKKYKTVLKHLRTYMDKIGGKIDFEDIDLNFYEKYTKFLMSEFNLSTNSIAKDITTIKVYLNDATDKGVNKNLSFKNKKFSAVTEKSDSIYLNDKELLKLFRLNLRSNRTYENVRVLFLIGCYTGLRYSDYSILSKDHIIDNKNCD